MVKKQATRKLLIDSFIELSKQMPFEKISIADITQNCGLSRKTFYNYFQDKYDLIEYVLITNFSTIANRDIMHSPVISCTKMFEYISEHISMFKSISRKRNEEISQSLYRVTYKIMSDYIAKESGVNTLNAADAFQLSCYVHGSNIKMLEWINDHSDQISAEMIGRYMTLAWPVGLAKYLHIENDDILSDEISFVIRD